MASKYSDPEDLYFLTDPDSMLSSLDVRPKRQLKLTEKGSSLFHEYCDVYINKLLSLGRNLETLLQYDISVCKRSELSELGLKLDSSFNDYKHLSDEYLEFLSRNNTHESSLEQTSHMVVRRTYMERVEILARSISKKLSSMQSPTPSAKSSSSSSSQSHHTVLQKRLSLEAAKARLDFVKKENTLKQHALNIQAELEELAAKKEIAVLRQNFLWWRRIAGRLNVWRRLEERYGAPSLVEASIRKKLENFKTLDSQDEKELYQLCDILNEIQSLKGNDIFTNLLAQFNTSVGITPIVAKLPKKFQDKWTTIAFRYKQQNNSQYPPFEHFLKFISEMATMCNDPGFVYNPPRKDTYRYPKPVERRKTISAHKTSVSRDNRIEIDTNDTWSQNNTNDVTTRCPVHKSKHSLNECEAFRKWRLDRRRAFLRQHSICFKCCASTQHQQSSCTASSPCSVCRSTLHPTAMHWYRRDLCDEDTKAKVLTSDHGGEGTEVSSKCTTLCGSVDGGRSCAKVVLAKVFPSDRPQAAVTVYVLLDDQSNHTLGRSELLNQLGVTSDPIPYRLKSCTGVTEASGRRAVGFCIQSMDGLNCHKLPPIIECNDIPDNMMEIPTPDVACAHPHLRHIAKELAPLRRDVGIQLLIGRDLVDVHQVQGQVTGPPASPFSQKLSLGWVIIGEVCLDGRHKPSDLSVLKTNIQNDGRGTIFTPCQNSIHLKVQGPPSHVTFQARDFKGDNVFYTDRHDNKVGNSVEDREFLSLMDQTFQKNFNGNWTSPLPFKNVRPHLVNNKTQVFKRAINLDHSLRKNPEKLKQMCEFMENIFQTGAAERAPEIPKGQECWYIPIFAVAHPKKPGKVRAVFDSSIVYQGCSLNDTLLSGPNLTNNLLGILLRFRKDLCAIAGDIQQMFYRFFVNERDRDYLRFYWYENNDPLRQMIEYRMTVHVFGNRPSHAVATYGLRQAVRHADLDVVNFVHQDFYVDDALMSRPTPAEVIDLMRRTQKVLNDEGKIRLHKIVSNVQDVVDAFPAADLGKDVQDFSIGEDDDLVQHSLGLAWNLRSDCFIFQKPDGGVSFTRRGILSRVNSIFDPIGFLSPLTICGKTILREMCTISSSWDDPLPEEYRERWESWSRSLDQLSSLQIPRMFVPQSLSIAPDPQVLIFSDASEAAIAAAAYLKVKHHIGFIKTRSSGRT
ncbi:uncharacterized protein LOC125646037 [Ostrea edulis]|uniref:uncharacterized protein LOC125646037 n=1 Tax=Ostrea edulis TaxID=37623 RepID=UPI0024AEA058|nr:uncharacterized protein LOC125646037 [Ostrea edulis]